MKIGIIAAESKEMMAIKKRMSNIQTNNKYNMDFFIGNIYNHEIVLVECGVGKVNAARTAQTLIDSYNVNYVINVGSAGAVNPSLNIKDIVIGESLIQYDFDITGIGDYEKGEICDVGRYIECDKDLVNKFSQILSSVDNDYNIYVGKIGTADYFCSDHEKGRQVHDEFGVECVEMEGAAIAQVCYLDKIPFIVIRGISDTVNGDNKIDFHTYLELASEQVALIIDKFLKDWR